MEQVTRYNTLRLSVETLKLLSDYFVDAEEALHQVYQLMWEVEENDPVVAGCYYNVSMDMFHPTLLLDEAKALLLVG